MSQSLPLQCCRSLPWEGQVQTQQEEQDGSSLTKGRRDRPDHCTCVRLQETQSQHCGTIHDHVSTSAMHHGQAVSRTTCADQKSKKCLMAAQLRRQVFPQNNNTNASEKHAGSAYDYALLLIPRTGCACGVMMLIRSSRSTSGSASRDSYQSLAVVQSPSMQRLFPVKSKTMLF